MNKKIKIVSTVALAGLLTLNVFNPKTLAAEINDAIETKPVGVFSKLVDDKTVAPFILQTNKDTLTLKEMNVRFSITKVNVKNENKVATGDTFVADGKEHTVIVYGDVNKDGKITPADALAISDYYANETGLDNVQKEAANVANHNGKLDPSKALRVQDFYVKDEMVTVIDKLPEAETVVKSDYTVTVNKNGIVNNTNTTATVGVKLSKTLDKATSVKVIIPNGKSSLTVVIPVAAHTDYAEGTINLSSLKDGQYEAKLVEATNEKNELGRFSITKNTVKPIAGNVKVVRVNTRTAKLASLDTGYNGDIKTVEYTVTKAGKEVKKGTINANNNSVNDYQIINELDEGVEYNFTYTVVNSYGSKSDAKTLVITSDANVKPNQKPEIETEETSFTWNTVSGKTYVVTSYKDENVVTTQEFTATSNTISKKVSELVPEVTEGKYKVSVYVKGDSNNAASETVMSDEVVIEKLASVTDLKFNNENDKVSLTWTNGNDKKVLKNSNARYEISLYTINEKGEQVLANSISAPAIDKNKVENVAINNDTIYVAKVKVVAENQEKYITSDEAVSNEFYKVTKPTITDAETSSQAVTLTAPATKINGKKPTYKVEVATIDSFNEIGEPEYGTSSVKDVEVKENKIVVDGLESDKLYAFKLIVSIDGNEVKSDYTGRIRTLPDLSSVKLVEKKEQAGEAGKVYYDKTSNKVYMLGNVGKERKIKEIDVTGDYAGSTKLENQLNIIKALAIGDEALISDSNVTLTLNEVAKTEKDLSKIDLSKVILSVKTNEFMKTIKTNASGVKELNLLAGLFDVSKVAKAEKITLANGVDITSASSTYTVLAGSKVRINGVYVTAKENTEITPKIDGEKLLLSVNVKGNTTNDLVFENVPENQNNKYKEVEIKFIGGNANGTDELLGEITIKTYGGKITVSSNQVAVKAPLTVEVNKGEAEVNVKDSYISGDKTVTVDKSEDKNTKLTANVTAKAAAPANMTDLSVDSTDEELIKIYGENKEQLQKIKSYIDAFGLKGTKATITVTAGSYDVVITFAEATADKTISNIK